MIGPMGILKATGVSMYRRLWYGVKQVFPSVILGASIGAVIGFLMLVLGLSYIADSFHIRIEADPLGFMGYSAGFLLLMVMISSAVHFYGLIFGSTVDLLRRQVSPRSDLWMLLVGVMLAVYFSWAGWDVLRSFVTMTAIAAVLLFVYVLLYQILKSVMRGLSQGGVRSLLMLNALRQYQSDASCVILFFSALMASVIFVWNTQSGLIQSWKVQLPSNTSNGFFIQMQEQDLEGLFDRYSWLDKSRLYPVIRGTFDTDQW